MYKNLKTPAAEWRMVITTCTGNANILKWTPAPENCKNQEINRIKSKKINRTFKL